MNKPKKPGTNASSQPTADGFRLVEVTRITPDLVRLDVFDDDGRAAAVLTQDEAKKIALALARA